MSASATALVAAFVGSAPGWAGVFLAFKANKRHLDRQTAHLDRASAAQTDELKAHITGAAGTATANNTGEATQ